MSSQSCDGAKAAELVADASCERECMMLPQHAPYTYVQWNGNELTLQLKQKAREKNDVLEHVSNCGRTFRAN